MIGNQSGKPPPLTSLTVSIFLIGDHDDGDDSFTGIQKSLGLGIKMMMAILSKSPGCLPVYPLHALIGNLSRLLA